MFLKIVGHLLMPVGVHKIQISDINTKIGFAFLPLIFLTSMLRGFVFYITLKSNRGIIVCSLIFNFIIANVSTYNSGKYLYKQKLVFLYNF